MELVYPYKWHYSGGDAGAHILTPSSQASVQNQQEFMKELYKAPSKGKVYNV